MGPKVKAWDSGSSMTVHPLAVAVDCAGRCHRSMMTRHHKGRRSSEDDPAADGYKGERLAFVLGSGVVGVWR